MGDGRVGVYVNVNDHYDVQQSSLDANERLMKLLQDNFDKSMERSVNIIDHIMSLAVPQES